MTHNIIINKFATAGAITQAKIANSLIDTRKETWVGQGENSIALDAFSKQFEELQQIITAYQTLLDGDLDAATKAVDSLFAADIRVSSLWK